MDVMPLLGLQLLLEIGFSTLGTPFSVDARRDNSARITCTLAAGKQTLKPHMLQGGGRAHNTHW